MAASVVTGFVITALHALDSRNCAVLLLLDLFSAFDTVDHEILIHRLRTRFGIKVKALDWFRSYLTNRSQFVNIDGSKSDTHNMTCAVPQGSVLGPILYLLYTSALADILQRHNMLFHFYADDTQLYTSFACNDEHDLSSTAHGIEDCLADIKTWMLLNKLKLIGDKTELLVIHSRYRPSPVFSLNCGYDIIAPSDMARNIGMIFDKNMTVIPQINSVCKGAFYHLQNIARIRKFLTPKSTEILVHAFISSKLDYCNSLLYGVPKFQLEKLQHVQNADARLITQSCKYDHITPVLINLHWLPVEYRVKFKLLLLTFKALNELAPKYLTEMIEYYTPSRTLRSSSAFLLKQVRFNLQSYGEKSFTISAPMLWNNLPLL